MVGVFRMYSKKILEELWKRNIEVGDRVSIEFGGEERAGVLIENYSYNTDVIEIKLDNGYNVGIKFNESLKLIKKKVGKPKAESWKEDDFAKYNIAVLMCGGTISSRVEYATGAVFPAATPEEFRKAFPGIQVFGGARFKNIMNVLSEDMTVEHWKAIGSNIYSELKEGKAVVATHGTDTLGYSAAAVSFMVQNPARPVVFTGAQRSPDRGSSDAKENLMNAAYFASIGRPGVYVSMHAGTSDGVAHVHMGTRARKMHTSRRDAFKSINALPVAKVDYTKKMVEYCGEAATEEWGRAASTSAEMRLVPAFNNNVGMVYIHPGIRPGIISKFGDYDGVVLMATGMGHVPANPFDDELARPVIKEVAELVGSGVHVVVAPQAIYGRINLNVYTAGRMLKEAGVIGHGCDWLPETAFVKLSWVLGQTRQKKKVQEMMYTNFAGELSERSPIDGFIET